MGNQGQGGQGMNSEELCFAAGEGIYSEHQLLTTGTSRAPLMMITFLPSTIYGELTNPSSPRVSPFLSSSSYQLQPPPP